MDTKDQKKTLEVLEDMYINNQLTGNESPATVRNSFPMFQQAFRNDPEKWARRLNNLRKRLKKRPKGKHDGNPPLWKQVREIITMLLLTIKFRSKNPKRCPVQIYGRPV